MEIRDTDDLRDDEYPDETVDSVAADTRPCPACGEDVHELCDHCPSCGHWITDGRTSTGKHTLLWIVIAVLTAVALILVVVL